jgi:hypothetical protein
MRFAILSDIWIEAYKISPHRLTTLLSKNQRFPFYYTKFCESILDVV